MRHYILHTCWKQEEETTPKITSKSIRAGTHDRTYLYVRVHESKPRDQEKLKIKFKMEDFKKGMNPTKYYKNV
jgi:hypothetical protein